MDGRLFSLEHPSFLSVGLGVKEVSSALNTFLAKYMEVGEPIDSETARILDLNSEYLGVSPIQLMENAGRAVAEEASRRVAPRVGP
jgi:hypothetical protein